MLRLIAVGWAVTCSLLIAAPVPKPTERELKARWGEIVKGAEDDRAEFRGGRLAALAASRKIDNYGLQPDDAVTPLRTKHVVLGDFTATVQLVMSKEKGTQGLYAKNRNGYVALPWRGEVRKRPQLTFEFEWNIWNQSGGRASVGGNQEFDGVAVTMRLRREDGILSGALSGDGKEWLEFSAGAVTQHPRLTDPIEVGLFVSPDKTGLAEATFTDFKLAAGKK